MQKIFKKKEKDGTTKKKIGKSKSVVNLSSDTIKIINQDIDDKIDENSNTINNTNNNNNSNEKVPLPKQKRKKLVKSNSINNPLPGMQTLTPSLDPSESSSTKSNKSSQKARTRSKSPGKKTNEPLRVCVYDKVRLKDRKRGMVKSIGTSRITFDNNDIMCEIEVKNISSSNNIHSKFKKTKDLYVPLSNIDDILEVDSRYNITVGDYVLISKRNLTGIVRYVGPTVASTGVSYGIELDEDGGKNDGKLKGQFYFSCEDYYGLFVIFSSITRIETPPKTAKSIKNAKKKNVKDNGNITAIEHKNTVSDGNKHQNANENENDEDDSEDDIIEKVELSTKPLKQIREKKPCEGFLTLVGHDEKEDFPPSVSIKSDINLFDNDSSNSTQFDFENQNIENEDIFTLNQSTSPKLSNNEFKQLQVDPEVAAIIRASPLNSPLTSPRKINDQNKGQSASMKQTFSPLQQELFDADLPSLQNIGDPDEQYEILKEKLQLCCATCTFNPESQTKMESVLIEKKEKYLIEIGEYIAKQEWFDEGILIEMLNTIAVNLFRALPYHYRPPVLPFLQEEMFDKDIGFEDLAWSHLKLVYDIFWRILNTPQVTAKVMDQHLKKDFLGKLVELYGSDDGRERAYLMMIVHKIYGRCLKLRPVVVDLVSNYLFRMIHTEDFNHYNGAVEILQVICAIIPGLGVPIKDTWKKFLGNVLVPLHKSKGLKKFWENLTQCCVNYVAKDQQGAGVILAGLLRYWPKQSPGKEEIFIMEVVNIVNVLVNHQEGFDYSSYQHVLVDCTLQLIKCLTSNRQPVIERAIAAWKEESIQRLTDYDRNSFYPYLALAFYRNRYHQYNTIKTACSLLEKTYCDKDPEYWKLLMNELEAQQNRYEDFLKDLRKADKFKKIINDLKQLSKKKKRSARRPKKPANNETNPTKLSLFNNKSKLTSFEGYLHEDPDVNFLLDVDLKVGVQLNRTLLKKRQRENNWQKVLQLAALRREGSLVEEYEEEEDEEEEDDNDNENEE